MRSIFTLLVAFLLAGCATPPAVVQPADFLLHDALFASPSERISADEVFALSDSMKQYLRTDIAAQIRSKGPQYGLIDALYQKGALRLDYDASTTRNAAQAFEARAGNCLSLVIMTAAFAKELGLQVRYQSAYLEEAVGRSGSLLLRSGHVNLTLDKVAMDTRADAYQRPLTIDFLPAEELRGLRTREISEDAVVAMFMNNRAVEALLDGRLNDAYAWARAAVHRSPQYLGAYNTLGVIYLRQGSLSYAEPVFQYVVARDADNKPALSNLARTLSRLGRTDEALAVYRRLAALEPDPPYHFFDLGLAAMKRKDFVAARDLFAREVARADHNPEFHFWLGIANLRLGDVQAARKQFAIALEKSSTRTERDLYAAKLDRLGAVFR